MKIIFLDFDGVLNNSEYLKQQSAVVLKPFDPINIKNLNYIIDATEAKIVISSDWRKFGDNVNLIKLLYLHGINGEIKGETPILDGMPRGMEIQGWLIKFWYTTISLQLPSFIILDDRDDMGYISDRLIQTDMATGLTKENAEQAIRMLNE